MVWFAFSIQAQVEKYGVYVGIAAFFGLAILTLLYFAQAREVKRLREWAGRAPERAQELEERVVAQAEAARRSAMPVPAGEPQRAVTARSPNVGGAQPVSAATQVASAEGSNGAPPRELTPAEIAAAAFAPAAGVELPEPAPPAPVLSAGGELPEPAPPAPVPPAGVQLPEPAAPAPVPPVGGEAAGEAAEAAGEAAAAPQPEPVANGNGQGRAEEVVPPPVPPAATPAARRAAGAPAQAAAPARAAAAPSAALPPRRPAPAARRGTPPAPRRGRGTGTIVALAAVGVLVLAGAAFAATQLLGGGSQPQPPNRAAGSAGGGTAPTPTPTASPALTRATTRVAVLNGTVIPAQAAGARDQLSADGYKTSNIATGNNTDQQRSQSQVLYRQGARRQAQDVAKILGIDTPVQKVDAETEALATSAGKGAAADVIVIVGADKAR